MNKDKYFFYRVYGLNIKSQIEINELIKLEDDQLEDIDVNIVLGEVDHKIKEKINNRIMEDYSRDNMWFSIDDIGIFNVIEGNCIRIELLDNYDLSMFKIYLLGIAFAMIKIQRDEIAMHGAAIDINNNGVLIIGKSGAGKSTLTTALRREGYKLLSDDMSSLEINENGIIINPSFPMQRIGDDIIDYFNYQKDLYNKIRLNREKYLVPVIDEFQKQDIKLSCIFNLMEGNGDGVEVNEVKGAEKIKLIINNIFRAMIFNRIEMTSTYLKKCVFIAKNIKVYNLIRPKNLITTDDQIQCIKDILYFES